MFSLPFSFSFSSFFSLLRTTSSVIRKPDLVNSYGLDFGSNFPRSPRLDGGGGGGGGGKTHTHGERRRLR
jgi:hypothetical protein